MSFSLLKHYLDLYISDTALEVSQSLYCFTTSICHGVENFFPRLWGTGISDAIFVALFLTTFVFSSQADPFLSCCVLVSVYLKSKHPTEKPDSITESFRAGKLSPKKPQVWYHTKSLHCVTCQ